MTPDPRSSIAGRNATDAIRDEHGIGTGCSQEVAYVRLEGGALPRRERKHAVSRLEPAPLGVVGVLARRSPKINRPRCYRFANHAGVPEVQVDRPLASSEREWLDAGLANGPGQFTLGLQHKLHHLAHRARPARPLRDELGRLFDLRHGIGDSHGEAHSRQDGQIR